MSTPKPSRVDRYAYWTEPPPEPSPRLAWWLHRIIDEGWAPNRRISREGYDGTAEFFGVYLWEYLNVLYPALGGRFQYDPVEQVAEWLDANGIDSSWVVGA